VGLYNFQVRFEEPILSGRKFHTIRAYRKHRDKPGDVMHLYVGLRRPGARLLGRPSCAWTSDITIRRNGRILVNGRELNGPERGELAWRDGFDDHAEMMSFWTGRLPFNGQILGWFPLKLSARK
jgi:hypothetical protein